MWPSSTQSTRRALGLFTNEHPASVTKLSADHCTSGITTATKSPQETEPLVVNTHNQNQRAAAQRGCGPKSREHQRHLLQEFLRRPLGLVHPGTLTLLLISLALGAFLRAALGLLHYLLEFLL